jgi:hypothetical protein
VVGVCSRAVWLGELAGREGKRVAAAMTVLLC